MMNHSTNHEGNESTEKHIDFGIILSEARQAKNYSVDEITGFLKIPARTIIALEANDIQQLPPPAFTQGYIRTYARFLEISEHTVLERYNQAVPHGMATDLKPRSNLPGEANSQSPIVKAMTILLVLAGVATVIYGSFHYYQEKVDDMESTLVTKPHSFTGNSLSSPGEEREQQADLNEEGVQVLEKTAVEDGEMTADEQVQDNSTVEEAADVSATEMDAADTDTGTGNDTIEFYAEKGSWLEVRDANNSRLFYNTLAPGKSKVLVGQAPFRITMGNANTTRVVINDLDVDISAYIRSSNTAIFSVSTKDDNIIFY